VKEDLHTFESGRKGRRIRQIPDGKFRVELCNVGTVRVFANEQTQAVPTFPEHAGNSRTDEPGSPCNECDIVHGGNLLLGSSATG